MLDGHRPLARLKIAAALALLDGRQAVSDEDWALAGVVLAVSDQTRAGVKAHLAATAAQANRARGRSEGERAVEAAGAVETDRVKRVGRSIMRVLRGDQWVTRRQATSSVSGRDRVGSQQALDALIDAGLVEVQDADGTPVYRAAGGGQP